MTGSLQGKILGNAGTSVVVSGAAAKTIQKVAQLKSGVNPNQLAKDQPITAQPKPSEPVPPKTNPNPEVNKIIPDNFTSKIAEHNTQLGVLNAKKTGIAGAHKQDAFLESVEITGAKVNLKTTDKNYPGLVEYKYQLPAIAGNGPNAGKVIGYKKMESKTTYDPAILPDAKVTNMSNQAAKQSENYFQSNPSKNLYDVKVDGYWFRVTKNSKTGEISNAFITMPPRNSK